MSATVTYKNSTLTTVNNTTKTLKTAGKYMEDDVTITDSGVYQSKTINPSESQQNVVPDSGYDALSGVTVTAIASDYIGSAIPTRSSADLSVSGANVTVPSGFYGAQVSAAVANGTEGTPTATKGTVSNNSITVTPSVTNTAGYISGGTKSGTSVAIAASELVSGSTTLTNDGTYDVTNYASAEVAIDYVSKTVPVVVNNHGTAATTCARSGLNSSIVSSSTGYITNMQVVVIAPNGDSLLHFPAGAINILFNRGTTGGNFQIQIDGIVKAPTAEWEHYKLYAFSSTQNVKTGWTIDIYDVSDPWPVDIVAEPLSVTSNGTYTAPTGTAYTPVTVQVPNSYAAGDEGKVVSNGALVSQSSSSTTQNGTVDTTLINSLSVNVPQNTLAVTLSWDDDYFGQYDGAWVPDATYAEIEAAYTAGKTIVVATDDLDATAEGWQPSGSSLFNYIVHYWSDAVASEGAVSEFFYTLGTNGISNDSEDIYYRTDDADATSSDVLSGKVFYNANGSQTGSIQTKTASDLTASGATVTVPAGFYASQAMKSVASGTEGTPTATKGSVSNHSVTVTPSVTNTAGYISGGTKSGIGVNVSASELVSGTKSITGNGTDIDVTNYASVDVAVPNSYSAGDEGKVVSNGALVAQGSDTVTQNDTYDTTLISSLTVNVSGGGGASVADVLQGDFPSGAVSFKATKNIPGRGVSGRSAMTSLEIDLTDNYILNGRAIENNSNMTLLVLTFPTSGSNTSNSDYCITANSKLKTLIVRGRVYNFGQSGIRANSLLEVVDIENINGSPTLFGNNCFYSNNNFKTLIIRDTSNVAKISSTTFTGSGLISSGVVYVPSALIASYQTASNWSSLYSGGKLTFSALENSVYASADWYKA